MRSKRPEASRVLAPVRLDTKRRAVALLASSTVCLLVAVQSAAASTITVGSPLMASFSSGTSGCACTWANSALDEPGANVISPVSGVIVRWRMAGAYSGGPFELRVLRPASGGQYTGAGTSSPMTPVGSGTQTFATDLPISAGDLIGIDEPLGSSVGVATSGVAGSSELRWGPPPLADNSTAPASGGPFTGRELGFNADVLPTPGITSLSVTSGPTTGGSAVAIGGHDFTGATAVSFGAVPAASFAVNSDGQITAVSPPQSAGAVDIKVTTPAGQSPAVTADRFAYTAVCVVPNLKGKKLKKAKKALKKASCRLGKVKPKGQKTGRVKKQRPKVGTVLPVGSKVNVKLG